MRNSSRLLATLRTGLYGRTARSVGPLRAAKWSGAVLLVGTGIWLFEENREGTFTFLSDSAALITSAWERLLPGRIPLQADSASNPDVPSGSLKEAVRCKIIDSRWSTVLKSLQLILTPIYLFLSHYLLPLLHLL